MLAHYSYKFVRLASILAVVLLSITTHVHAEDNFTVDKVSVDADGKDTSDARTKALAQGETEAFRQLITKLAPDKANGIIAKTPPSAISPMIHGFEVVEERMTSDHYHAVLRYQFSPQPVQALLPQPSAPAAVDSSATPKPATAAAPVIPASRKSVLILPVYNETRASTKLWQDDNKWRNIWYEAALEFGGGLVVVPQGNVNDRVDVDDTNIANATSQSLSRFYERYGVGEIYILTAYFNQRADPKPALEITTRRLSPTVSEVSHTSYTILSTETPEKLMARASGDIARNIYKLQTIDKTKIEYQREKEISARVNVSSVSEWVQLRKHLLTHGNIVGIRLTAITNLQTHMLITYKGTPETLGKTLVASGLRVMQDGDSLVLALK